MQRLLEVTWTALFFRPVMSLIGHPASNKDHQLDIGRCRTQQPMNHITPSLRCHPTGPLSKDLSCTSLRKAKSLSDWPSLGLPPVAQTSPPMSAISHCTQLYFGENALPRWPAAPAVPRARCSCSGPRTRAEDRDVGRGLFRGPKLFN